MASLTLPALEPSPVEARPTVASPERVPIGMPRPTALPSPQSEFAGDALDPTQIRLDRIGSEHGLAHNSVTAILQDHEGFLWFGTRDGLSRYDGYEFRVFRHPLDETTPVDTNYVLALAEAPDGRIWVGTFSGLYTLDSRRSGLERAMPDAEQLRGATIRALHVDADAQIWIGTDLGLFVTSGSTAIPEPVDLGDGPHVVSSVRSGPDGAVWTLVRDPDGRGWLRRLTGPPEAYELGSSSDDFLLTARATVWVDPQGPLPFAELDLHEWTEDLSDGPDGARGPRVTSVASDADGNAWFGTFAGAFVSNGHDPAVRVRASAGPEHTLADEVTSVLVDRFGAVWIGTYDGILRYDPRRKPFAHLGHRVGDPESLASDHVSAIAIDAGGTLWVGTYGAGIDDVDLASGHIRHHRRAADGSRGLCDDYVWGLSASRRTRLWIATQTGLCELDHEGRFHLRYDETGVAAVAEGPDGTVWIGTPAGLRSWSPGEGLGQTVAQLSSWIDVLHIDDRGVVWAGSGGTGDVIRHDPRTGDVRIHESIVDGGVIDIYRTHAGRVLLAAGTGLASFHDGGADSDGSTDPDADGVRGSVTRLWRGDAATGSVVYSVREDPNGALWLGTGKGLVRLDPAREATDAVRRFDLGDNVGNLEFNRHAALRAADGRLYFGGMNGLTHFDPAEIEEDSSPPVMAITGVRTLSDAGERAVNPVDLERLVLRPGDHAVTFEFVALDFRTPPRSRYEYRLDGFDLDWIDNGQRRTARYTNLSRGDYVFRVRGANADGAWNEEGVALAVTVLPAWWQTWPFRFAMIAMVVGALTLAYQLRMARLRALDRVRLRIAGDLHDDLGSDLSGIAMLSGVVGQRDYLRPSERTHLAEIETTAVRVMEGLRDIVWYIAPEHDNLEAMARRMRAVADRLLPNSERRFRFDVPEQSTIDMNRRRELFLIYKELIHNASRHAEARRVEIRLIAEGGVLDLVVADDGAGFDPARATDGSGLRNLRARAERLGAELRIESEPGSGTSARVRLDLARTRHGGGRS